MEELIYLLVQLLMKGFDKSGGARRQQDQAEQARQARLAWERRQAWEQQQRGQQVLPFLPPPPAKVAKQGKQSKQPKQAKRRAPAVAPAAPLRPFPAESEAGPRSASAFPPAASAVSGLKEPRTLREQFVLAEILRPPLALRPPRV